MKFLQLLFAMTLIAMSSTSCEQLNQLTIFDYNQNLNFVLNETEAGEDISFSREISVDLQQELEDRNLGKVEIESIRPKSVVITLSDAGSDFSLENIIEADIQVSSTNNSKRSIATLVTIASRDATSVELDVNDVELLGYLSEDKFSYTATFLTNAKNPQGAKVSIALTHEVDTKL